MTLSQTIRRLSTACSRLPPAAYYYIFIPSDVVSLTLQAAGGGISSSTIGANQVGVNITLAGLAFQVASLLLFIALSVDYAVRYGRYRKEAGLREVDLVTQRPFRVFVGFLSLSVVCILIRCAYRIAELHQGYGGDIFHDEGLFIGLEGV